MKNLSKRNYFLAPLILAAAAMAGCASVATGPVTGDAPVGTTWKWKYRTYDVSTGDEMNPGALQVTKTSTGWRARLAMSNATYCYIRETPAEVVVSANETIIYTLHLPDGCEDRRYIIGADGGRLETRTPARKNREGKQMAATPWAADGKERGLTPIH